MGAIIVRNPLTDMAAAAKAICAAFMLCAAIAALFAVGTWGTDISTEMTSRISDMMDEYPSFRRLAGGSVGDSRSECRGWCRSLKDNTDKCGDWGTQCQRFKCNRAKRKCSEVQECANL